MNAELNSRLHLQDRLLTLTKLPTEAQIEEVRQQRFTRAQRQIERERRTMETEAKAERERDSQAGSSREQNHDENNPLLEQMNIIRDYIKEARREMRFEEVR